MSGHFLLILAQHGVRLLHDLPHGLRGLLDASLHLRIGRALLHLLIHRLIHQRVYPIIDHLLPLRTHRLLLLGLAALARVGYHGQPHLVPAHRLPTLRVHRRLVDAAMRLELAFLDSHSVVVLRLLKDQHLRDCGGLPLF